MRLANLLKAVMPVEFVEAPAAGWRQFAELPASLAELDVTAVCDRAQDVREGGLFVAVTGHKVDGHSFVNDAFANGAVAAVVEKPVQSSRGPTLHVPDTRRALALLAAEFFGHPSYHMTIIGITGTNGKTTTAFLIEKILQAAGYRVGVLGTLNCRYAGNILPSGLTTPGAPELHALLARMLASGITHVVMEISSHALALKRVEGLALDIGVFTNFTQDHLDFHTSMEDYWRSKKQLFLQNLSNGPKVGRAIAVVNCHNSSGIALRHELNLPVVTVGFAPENMVYAADSRFSPDGIQARLVTPAGPLEIESPLTGHHNLENILCAVGVGQALQVAPAIMAATLAQIDCIPGRLQRVPDPGERLIYVDYAHTPDALENALRSLQRLTPRRIICVFGCGGNRDRRKRPLMGAIAAHWAQLIILTSDNPRLEAPLDIIRDILEGIPVNTRHPWLTEDAVPDFTRPGFLIEPDRRNAIRLAINAAEARDVVLIAGKGHETYQIVGDQTLLFDDVVEANRALADRRKGLPVRGVIGFKWTVADILAATTGELRQGNVQHVFSGICTDSRRLVRGDLFVALRGEHYDGHDFIYDALEGQAGGILLENTAASAHMPLKVLGHNATPASVAVIGVADTLNALGELAAWQRSAVPVRVVALTGSNGKTTTRKMISLILSQQHYVLATQGNFNNLVGLPLTLLNINALHEWVVLEMGMNRRGEIARLTDISRPEIGVITGIAAAHLQGLETIEGVMAAKGELLAQMPDGETAVLNMDDPYCRRLGMQCKGPVLYFGFSERADVRAEAIRFSNGGVRFDLRLPGDGAEIYLNTPARCMVANAAAAAAVGYLAGLTAHQIKIGLESFTPVAGRMQLLTSARGVRLIDDTYNANPASMAAAIDTLKQVHGTGRAVLVVGDMLELGPQAARWHQELGAQAAAADLARLYATGNFADDVFTGAVASGMPAKRIMVGTQAELSEALGRFLQAGDRVLVKGSRGMRMERVVKALME